MSDMRRVRLEQQRSMGWKAEVLDYSTNPPTVVPGSRKFVETAQVSSLFKSSFSFNSGVMEHPIGLCAIAIAPSHAAYMYLEPAKFTPVNITADDRKTCIMWLPASIWTIKSTVGSKRCLETVRMGLPMPNELGGITPDSPVHSYPMGNCYDDLRICWGTVPDRFTLPKDIKKAINAFFTSDFNGDLWEEDEYDLYAHAEEFSPENVKGMNDIDRLDHMLDKAPRDKRFNSLKDMWKRTVDDISEEENDD